jgi:hypothetical protein
MTIEKSLGIQNTTQFSLMIEELVKDLNVGYLEAITHYCERHDMEVESAAKLLNATIKGQLQSEAEDLHYLPRTSRLPI